MLKENHNSGKHCISRWSYQEYCSEKISKEDFNKLVAEISENGECANSDYGVKITYKKYKLSVYVLSSGSFHMTLWKITPKNYFQIATFDIDYRGEFHAEVESYIAPEGIKFKNPY